MSNEDVRVAFRLSLLRLSKKQGAVPLFVREPGLNTIIEEPPYPEEIRCIPTLLLEASNRSHGGALRAWTLARALDPDGRGAVDTDRLQGYLGWLGVHPRTSRRWLAAAVQVGLFIPYSRTHSGKDGYRYVGPGRAAYLAGCQQIGSRFAQINARNLAQNGWRSFVWGAFIATLGGRPASREKKAQITSVPKQTQLHLESRIPVQKTPNYVITDLPASHLDGVREFQKSHAFVFRKPNGETVVAWRGPDSCSVPVEVAKSLSRGRLKKAHKQLNALSEADWFYVEPAPSADMENTGRLYFATHTQAERHIRKITRADVPSTHVHEIFIAIPDHDLFPRGRQTRAGFWQPVQILD